MRLNDAKTGSYLKVIRLNIDNIKLKNYLMIMGLVRDTNIKIIKKALFNGPIIINLRNYNLCISNNEASNIEVDYV